MKKLTLVSISELRQSKEQESLYDPPSYSDITELAESIKKDGLLHAPVITEDRVIVSGHRRVLAYMRLGEKSIRCKILPITYKRNGKRFLRLLREANRQRTKKVSEVIKEEIVDTPDKGSSDDLKMHIVKSSNVNIELMKITGHKKRKKIMGNRPVLEAAQKIINDLRDYWPLSDRTIHYKLLNNPPLIHDKKTRRYENDERSYGVLTDILTRGRLENKIPWESIGDETRPFVPWDVYESPGPFIGKQLKKFMTGYHRNYLQSQPNWIEIVAEKLTLENIISPVAMEYHIPYTIGRGYSSLSPRHNMAIRFKKSGKVNLVLLFLSDHDPSGLVIAESFANSMWNDFGIENIKPIRVALTWQQIKELNLPTWQEVKKKTQSDKKERGSKVIRERYITTYGKYSFELESITPSVLQDILKHTIENVIDAEMFNKEVEIEKSEDMELEEYRKKVMEVLNLKP